LSRVMRRILKSKFEIPAKGRNGSRFGRKRRADLRKGGYCPERTRRSLPSAPVVQRRQETPPQDIVTILMSCFLYAVAGAKLTG
jgi:hypothetical protein